MSDRKMPYNIMEDIVEFKLDELIRAAGACSCDQCRADSMAIALNKLPAKYVATLGGGVFARYQLLDTQMQTTITTEILQAIALVRKFPHHGEEYR